ncbi:histone-lysine N-methyltransferase SETMAR [Elysia marginata]|uniref:Histone-lysine N-methyltransferase SETMAR n=1 Tax=Elysia marginata TaxID=1093978 RepID=A0AAV4J6H4_9GAST|nr:histone-lysine N-methyltransferase SETMAR [Elysia marginata]
MPGLVAQRAPHSWSHLTCVGGCLSVWVSVYVRSANQKAVDKVILGNWRIKQKDIAKELEISKERVQHIITDILGYRKVSARWVPQILTDELKMQRKTMCAELLKHYEEEGEEFIQRIVTGDESWVHHYDPKSKRQPMEYRHRSSPSSRKFKVVASARKVMLTVFLDSEGIVHIEFLNQGNTIDSERYISTLRKLSVRLKRVRPTKHAILHHDNARPHKSRQTEEALHKMNFVVLPHPSYSPDLAPSDSYLFRKLKEHLRGNLYESDEDVEAAVRHWFTEKCVDFFTDGMRQLVSRWQLCDGSGWRLR